jgi:hypothetical protein
MASIRDLQLQLPWTIKYSSDFRANPQPHKEFAHALLHVQKACGKLAEFVNAMDHDKDTALKLSVVGELGYVPYVADLVVCALRMANTFPGRTMDLERAVIDRIQSKNGVKLDLEKPPMAPEIVPNGHGIFGDPDAEDRAEREEHIDHLADIGDRLEHVRDLIDNGKIEEAKAYWNDDWSRGVDRQFLDPEMLSALGIDP